MKVALIEKEAKLMWDGEKSYIVRLIDSSIGENDISTTLGKSISIYKLKEKLRRWGYSVKMVESVQLVNILTESRSWS